MAIDGECETKGDIDLDTLIKPHQLEERIYRMRCVEGWSMVIPWVGFPLRDLLARFKPTAKAKYVAFETLLDPKQMPGQRSGILPWPYVEALRMDEAMRAVEVLHDQPFMGRKMTVSGAKSKGQDEREDMEGRDEREPTRAVLASTAPAVAAAVVAEPVIETIVETVAEAAEETPVAAAENLEAKYGFDEPQEKTEEA